MEKSFRDYYQQRLLIHTRRIERPALREALEDAVGVPPSDPLAKEAALGAVQSAQETADRLGLDLRPDAELLLLLIADELVATPVAAVTPEAAPELPEALRADAETLIINAEQSANDGEVSAHAVVDSLSRSWGELQSARFRFWDDQGGSPTTPPARKLGPSSDLDVGPDEAPAGGVA